MGGDLVKAWWRTAKGSQTPKTISRPFKPRRQHREHAETGRVNADGTATIWAVTSTVSASGDQGADPNKLVAITDDLSATTLPGSEAFTAVRSAGFGEVLRGISFTPGTTDR